MAKQNKQHNASFYHIAFFYDALARIASLNQINKSQLTFLSHLSTQSQCLILGGGTGHFLQKLLEENKTIHVTYVDASVKMIESAQKRIAKNLPNELHRIIIISACVEDFIFENYDLIICNYFLDLFDDAYVTLLIERFKQHLNKDALLYITDFTIPEKGFIHWSTNAGLKILYKFFKWTTNLPTQKLPAIDTIVRGKGFCVLNTESFLKGILKCTVYKYIY